MPTATLTSKGRITLPREIRDAPGVSPGDKLAFRRTVDGQIVVEARNVDFRSLAGMLHPRKRGATLGQIEQAIRKAWAGGRASTRPGPRRGPPSRR
jgi:AbrB family looped-hinge helix DNA binding protein